MKHTKWMALILAIALVAMAASGCKNKADISADTPPATADTQAGQETQGSETDASQDPSAPSGSASASDPTTPTIGTNEGVEEWDENDTTGNQGTTGEQGTTGGQEQPGSTEITNPEEPESEELPEAGTGPLVKLTYEAYLNMSTAEQQAYFNSFSTVDAFYEWQDTAYIEYEAANSENVIVGSGNLNVGTIIDSITGRE